MRGIAAAAHVKPLDLIAAALHMDEEAWRRHANPWSVWTRIAAIPALVLAIWSRDWIGWWALAPVALVLVWLWLNPRIFPAVTEPRSWESKGIHGERLWLLEPARVPPRHRAALRRLLALGLVGMAVIAWGLIALRVWPTLYGATILVLAQLWRIDRFALLYEETQR